MWIFRAAFLQEPPQPVAKVVVAEKTVTLVRMQQTTVPVSAVNVANPYVFVDSAALGLATPKELFAAGKELARILETIRCDLAPAFGLTPPGAFPKVAAVAAARSGVAIRALSVPGWHPSVALTGAVCAAAAAAAGTVVARLAPPAPLAARQLTLRHPSGSVEVGWEMDGDALVQVAVSGKQVRLADTAAQYWGSVA
jgi:2-methylaconitate cis-trans-isomerase PrpF